MVNGAESANELLVVDDEPQVLAALKDLLEDEFDVHLQTSAHQALGILAERPTISVVISDQRMPDMTGDEFLARARQLSLATRLLITGHADLNAVIRAINDGKVFGYISKPWDPDSLIVTVHKAVEHYALARELEHERALLHNLMDSLPDAISFKATDGSYLRVNRAKADALGLGDTRAAVGITDDAFCDPEHAARIRAEEEQIFRTGRPIVDQIETVPGPGGSIRWFSSTKAPIFDQRGRVGSLVCVARDITERERARRALAESEQRYRSLYNRTPVMMHSTDDEGRLISVSDKWCAILGHEREAVLGQPATMVMTPAGREAFLGEIMPRLRREEHVEGVECQLVSSRGRVLDTLVSGLVERDAAGGFQRHLFVINDITQQKALQAQLLQAQKMEAVGQLAGGIAHDFNNLLMVVIGNLDLPGEPMPPEIRQAIDRALRAAERGTALTRRLLAFSRMQHLSPAQFDMNQLITGLEELLRRTLGATVVITTALQPDLWPVLADRTQVENAVLNLAINARDAMPDGGTLRIETANVHLGPDRTALKPDVRPGDYVMVAVTDTGCGMPQEVIERAVEPFFTTKQAGRGTGLGLSMVYGFARQSEGHLEIESEIGRGTTVRLYLRRAVQAAAQAAPGEGAEMPRGTETVLVVDDDPEVRRLAVRQLRSLGYRVLEASEAVGALAILDGPEPVDLMFSDVIMPGRVTARELAEEAQRRRPGLPVLFTSGHAHGTAAGQDHLPDGAQLLPKPYRKRDLALKLRELLDCR
jgi:PAS domain S-box-containing protein